MEQQQNNNILIKKLKKQSKPIPIELLFNLFKSTNISLIDLEQMCLNKMDKMPIIINNQLLKYWYNYVKKLLISSGVVNIFIGEDLKKMKLNNEEKKSEEKIDLLLGKVNKEINELKQLKKYDQAEELLTQTINSIEKTKAPTTVLSAGQSSSSTSTAFFGADPSHKRMCEKELKCDFCHLSFDTITKLAVHQGITHTFNK